MQVLSISSLNKTLEQLNSTFQTQTRQLHSKIQQHQAKFTQKDLLQFKELIEEIKIEAMTKINTFFKHKIQSKIQNYQEHIEKYQSAAQNIQTELIKFQSNLKQQTLLLKQQQNRKQSLMEHFSKKYRYNFVLKQAFGAFKKNHQVIAQERKLNQKMAFVYHKNLMKKVFFPWRSLTYKEGHKETVKEQVYEDISSIHSQYQSIISILKAKINQTEQLTKIKKAAKGQFAYALNKNLLKTISNLSLQVMSLNQMSLSDGQVDSGQSKSYMAQLDFIISKKMKQVQKYRKNLVAQQPDQKVQKRTKKIRFVQK